MQDDEVKIGSFRGVRAGEGGFATIYRVTDSKSCLFALKLVDPDVNEAICDSIYHEYTVQSELIHPQVVHAHAFGIHENRPYVVFDWVDGAELFERFTEPASDDFIQLLRQIARVMLFVHHRGWVHGDLKPENFRWRAATDGTHELCLLDFGLARPIGDADRPRGAGTVGYCAPEFLNNLPADGRADWYAVGVILYEWIFGVRPYASDDPAIEVGGHLEGSPDFDRPRLRPAPAWADEVIQRLLGKTADERADDEFALLAWLSKFDFDLEPTALLNDQLRWHTRSEAFRLRTCESELLRDLHHELSSGNAVRWTISSHGAPSTAWQDRITALCSRIGYVTANEIDSNGVWVLRDPTPQNPYDARLEIRLSPTTGTGCHSGSVAPSRSMTLLQWDREEVRMYLRGVVGDDDVAETWADSIHSSTCGLPRAVSTALQDLVDHAHLKIDADGWGIDHEALRQWRDTHLPQHIGATLGALGAPQLRLCQWLALGEGEGASSVICRLWESDGATYDDTLRELCNRGVVTSNSLQKMNLFNLRLRLHGHDEIIRVRMPSELQSRMSRALAALIAGSELQPDSTRARILGHAFSRAAIWDKSAEEFSRAASFAIASDDRELAMRFIALAQESAGRIEDEAQRRHWIGHARMVEGDLQKAAGQLDVARQIYRELLAICRASKDQRLLAETLHDLGDLYRMMRRYDKGIRAERRARQIWEAVGDRAELSRSLNSLGNLCRIAGDVEGARTFFIEALGIQRELGLDKYAATNLNNIGLNSWEQYKFDEAEQYFLEALAIQERLNVPVEIARVLNNLGVVSFVRGHLDAAASHFTRAAELNASAGAQSEELYNHRNLVEVSLEQGDLRTSVSLGQQVYLASLELGDVSTSVEVAAVLADAYLRAGDYRSASRLRAETVQRSMTLKNDELRAYLELQKVASLMTVRRHTEALASLDALAPVGAKLPTRYLGIDAAGLRLQICAAVSNDMAAFEHLLAATIDEAHTIGALHKAAGIALIGLLTVRNPSLRDALVARIDRQISISDRWHWTPAYRAWQARSLMACGQLDEAMALITHSIDQLRRNGCWEMLWRSLVLQGKIAHAQADYEPAIRALDEAASTLKIVAETVEDGTERSRYLDCDDARTLERIRERITALVG